MINRISFTIRGPAPIGFSVGTPQALDFDISRFAVVRQALPAYDGPMEVTPSRATQVLLTNERSVYGNITVNPIPSNYGLITYNGSKITVS